MASITRKEQIEMAKLLLACDDYIYTDGKHYYAASQEKYDFYKRYLRVFEEVRMITRCIYESSIKKERILLDSRIDYVPLPMFRGPKEYALKYFEIGSIISRSVNSCDAAIVRIPSTVAERIGKKVMKTGKPYAVEVVYDAEDGIACSRNFIERSLWRLIDRNMKQICANADGVSCVTEKYLQKHYSSKKHGHFVANYSSLALPKEFYGQPRKYPLKEVLTIAHTATQVDFDGVKGHKELIEALAMIKNKGVKVRVKFAGGDYLNGFQQLTEHARKLGVEDMIEFIGYINKTELKTLLENSDLFVLPTRAEGLPRVIIEAISQGLPCVSTNVSGNPELLPEEYLVDYHDVSGLAEKIIKLAIDKEAYENASLQNYNRSLLYEASILEKRRDAFYYALKTLCEQPSN